MSERSSRTPPIFHTSHSAHTDLGARLAGGVAWNLSPSPDRPARTVRFPKNRVLGEIFTEPYPASGWDISQMKRLGLARGEVRVPASHRLVLRADEETSERDLKALAKLGPRDLQSLLLSGCEITDAGLAYLKNLTWLEHLDLSCNRISGEGLVHLEGMLLLERLEVWGCDLTVEGLAHLPPLPLLRDLAVSLNLELADGALTHLDKLPTLERLDLHGTPIGGGALIRLKKMRKLRYLNVSHTKISRNGAMELCAALLGCEISWAPTSSWQD
jgi:Leucine Rich repeat